MANELKSPLGLKKAGEGHITHSITCLHSMFETSEARNVNAY